MIDYPDFDRNHYSTSAAAIYKIGYDSIRLMKLLCYYDRV